MGYIGRRLFVLDNGRLPSGLNFSAVQTSGNHEALLIYAHCLKPTANQERIGPLQQIWGFIHAITLV